MQDIEVFYRRREDAGGQSRQLPIGCLNQDISEGTEANSAYYVFIRPLVTRDRWKAASSFEFVMCSLYQEGMQDLAKGSAGKYRYLRPVSDNYSRPKITSIELVGEKPTGTDHCTENINADRDGRPLYLCWKLEEAGSLLQDRKN